MCASERSWNWTSGGKEPLLLSMEQAGMGWLFLHSFVVFLQESPAIPAEWTLLIRLFRRSMKRIFRCLRTSFTNEEPDAENWVSGKNR